MFCCKCGIETPDHSNFCWHCGAAVKSEPAEVKTSTTKTLSFDVFKRGKRKKDQLNSKAKNPSLEVVLHRIRREKRTKK